jgi:hypothetical protein
MRIKYSSTSIVTILFTVICSSILWGNDPVDRLWEKDIDDIKRNIKKSTIQFTPRTNPDYKNKIIEFVNNMDSTVNKRMLIIRENTTPVKDYIFIRNKLYTIKETHGPLNKAKESNLRKSLGARFGTPNISSEKDCTVYSYSNSKTKILYYKYHNKNEISKCNVYYYTQKIFRMMLEL